MEPKQRTFSVWYTVVAMLVLLGIQAFLLVPHPESMSYSEFKALLRAGKVSELGLYRDTIEGTFSPTGLEGVLSKEKIEEITRSGKSVPGFVTTRVEDPGLVPELEAAHVGFTGHVTNTWIATLLSWNRVILRVRGVDALHRHFVEKGLRPTAPRNAERGERYFEVSDPQGVVISFAEVL